MPTLGTKTLIQIAPGVSPETDLTNLESIYYTNGDKIRFQHGKLRKLNGWIRKLSTNNQRIYGAARTVYNYTPTDGIERTIIGTSENLYVYQQGAFYNITPLETSNVSIANSLDTVYYTDAGYSVSTVTNSNVVTFNIPHWLNVGDSVAISGVVGTVGGVSSTLLNDTFIVIAIPNSFSFQVIVGATASSNDTGGGTNITYATAQLIITLTNHELTIGDRIKIASAATVGNILDTAINKENIVTAVISLNQFVITTTIIASSLVTAGGGGSAVLYKQIASGNQDASYGFGYGGGLYGQGVYGVGKSFIGGFGYPRIWSCDTYGNNLIVTPGNGSGLYIWANDIDVAPTILSGAPSAVNWVFESHGMVCVLGSSAPNVMQSSNVGNATQWTPSAASTATTITVPGVVQFISSATARNNNLLFTINKVYLMKYENLPFIWSITELMATDGLIGPRARVNVEDAVFWMGNGDFFVFDGTMVSVLPNNTAKRYIYDNLNNAQSYKTFASVSTAYNEIWWTYPSGTSLEPNNYIIYNYKEQHWTIGTFERTGAVEPANATAEVLMVQSRIMDTVNASDNPLATYYYILDTDPISTTNTSATIVITVTNNVFIVGDTIEISGAITTNGINASDINGIRTITNVSVNTITIVAGASATSTGTGGGNDIEIGTKIMKITMSRPLSNNQIITISNAAAFGGLSAADINSTFVVRKFTNISIDVVVANDYSTSQATGGGLFVELTYERTGRLFQHEVGYNDYDSDNCDISHPDTCVKALYSYAETNYAQLNDGNLNTLIYSVIPDSTQLGTMTLSVLTKQYPQSLSYNEKGPFNITEYTEKVDVMVVGRQRKYIIASNEIDQYYFIGKWYEQVKETTPI